MMRKFDWVRAYNRGGQRAGKYFDVGVDDITGELHNPHGYPVLELRHAIKRAQEREIARHDRDWRNER
jgi:hypothetical protein